MTRPAAYLRKSKDAATKADHLAILTAAVHADGHNGDTVVYDDWARSGDIKKLSKRTGWRALCEAIERDEHDVVFMNDLDRGGRSVEEWARFMRVARDRGVRVVAGGVDWSAPDKRMEFYLRAVFAEEELERAKSRSARTREIRERRGDATVGGHAAPYGSMWARAGDVGMVTSEHPDPRRVVVVPNPDEPVEVILDAVRESRGNVLRAAKLLNERGVPSRGGRSWEPRTISRILDSRGVSRGRRGANGSRRRSPSDAPLSRLVECPCGTLMTPTRDPRTKAWASLYCGRGHKLGVKVHGPYVARARYIEDRLREELAGQESKTYRPTATVDATTTRAALEARKRKLGIALADEAIDEDDYRERMDAVKAELADLDDDDVLGPTITMKTRKVDWTAPVEVVGEQLRRLVRVVRLGADMLPVEVVLRA